MSPKENGTISSRNASVASLETPAFLVKKAFSTWLFLAGTSQFTHALFYHTLAQKHFNIKNVLLSSTVGKEECTNLCEVYSAQVSLVL